MIAERLSLRLGSVLRLRTPRTGGIVRRLTRRRLAALLTLVVLAVLGGAGWLWLRQSSLVSVQRVTVVGATGPDARQIRAALISAARTMTTLAVNHAELLTAVAAYPVVRGVLVSTEFPHGMRIRVIEQTPIATILAAGRESTVARDGTVLADVPPKPWFPVIVLRVPPGGGRVTDPAARAAVALLVAAPDGVLGKIAQVTEDAAHGLTAQLRGGPKLYFGQATALSLKWGAALAVLATAGSVGAGYIDVTDPRHPAAGIGSDVPGAPAPCSIRLDYRLSLIEDQVSAVNRDLRDLQHALLIGPSVDFRHLQRITCETALAAQIRANTQA